MLSPAVPTQVTEALVAELTRQGIKLWLDGEQLRIRAPQGALDDDLRASLTERKSALVEFLRGQREGLRIEPQPAARYAPFPLTDLQQSYWLGQTDAFDLGNLNAHVYTELDIPDVDIGRARAAIQKLIERHDMLRSFVLPSGEQVVLERVPDFQLPHRDLRQLDDAQRGSALEQTRRQMSESFKSTDSWPLFEVRAHQLPLGRVRFHVSVSLLVGDAASLRALFDELPALYRDLQAELPAPASSFRDYVQALSAFRDGPSYRRQEQYWLERLDDLPPAPELPLAIAPSSVSRPSFTRRSARLDAETWSSFKSRARAAGVFHAAALCAAYSAVLARWSKSPKFTLNILDSQRPALQEVTQSVFGAYSSTTLTSVDASSRQTFKELASQLHARRLLDRQNGMVSGVHVLRELNRRRGTASQASMPVVFNCLDSLFEADADLLAHEVFTHLQTPQVMLDHMVLSRGRALELHWDVVESLFPERLVDDMFTTYEALLRRLAGDAAAWELPLSELLIPPPTPGSRSQRPLRDARLSDDIWRWLASAPDRLAVREGESTLTFRQLLGRASHIAHWLRARGAERGRLVAVVMRKGWEQLAAVIAIHEVAGAYLPIDPDLPNPRIRALLARGDVRLALSQRQSDNQLDWPPGIERMVVTESEAEPVRLETHTDSTDLAYVIFTSGSTGEPKGVMIDHRGALNTVDDINARFSIGPDDRVLAVSSLGFDLSVYDVFGLLGAGGSVVLPAAGDARDPERLLARLVEGQVTVWNSVPATMELLVEYLEARGQRLPSCLRLVMLSGDWIPVTLPERIRRLAASVDIVSLGGATEASIWSIAYPIRDVEPHWRSIPYGTALTNQRVDVLNDALEPCPTWVTGEIYIGGVGLALGYFKDAEQTASRFVQHPRTGERLYRTGDWGRLLPDGNIEFLGRDDLQVKVQGFRIELGEIEAALGRHSDVRAAVVTVVSPRGAGKQLAAYVVPKREGVAASDLRAFVGEQLPDYMVPTFVTFLAELPLTSNGKVDRKALPSVDRGAAESVPPSSEHEQRLTALWESILERGDIGVTDNFFELGGSSLGAVRLSALIEREFGKRLGVSQLLRAPTIASMAPLLEQAPQATGSLVPIAERPGSPTLVLVHPVGGNIVCYQQLAELLPEYSIFGLQALESEGPVGIEQLAAHYVRELIAREPPGPWLIGGWSMGGIIAAEMSAQLAQQQREVRGVLVFDSLLPPAELVPAEPWLVQRFLTDLGAPAELCQRAQALAAATSAVEALEQMLPQLPGGDIGAKRIAELFQLFARNQRALLRHEPRAVPAPLLLVRAEERLFEGWRDPAPLLADPRSDVRERSIDASHFTLLQQPAVAQLATLVRDFLAPLVGLS